MREIPLKEAKATLSRVLDEAIAGRPSIITRRGRREGVILSYSEFERLSRTHSFGWLSANAPLDADEARPD
ncbi:type II toxin-antitoxin system Phd/YefM family antitoxin [Kumtagia ephedrae]|uniref:Antitoxin n=1 Tax=Kumtagia ephedrae TaxID=2116701 RepID=A0A2P7S6E3_9HYPH|nr:type II toxin-antitoxin system Phd/YefM family antitoxin [Mesorhizobium ephedrae]PSJ58052.1 type II toxin-antitoxin system prevent-host-death family antitoxin [Mesorhizobium ephedrae]